MLGNVGRILIGFNIYDQPNAKTGTQLPVFYLLLYNKYMYLTKAERKETMALYGCDDAAEISHYEVGPDTWIYLFELNGSKFILISTDYTGDYEFDVFPHLLKYEGDKLKFVLQREISVKDDSLRGKATNTMLFEYTD